MLQVRINNQDYECADGITILQALRAVGIKVPTLCHDQRLAPCGDCRMCLVRIAGQPRLATACETSLSDGRVIETHTPELEAERRRLLRLFTDRYPPAPVHLFPDKPQHRYLKDYGLEHRYGGVPDPALLDDAHPYICVDMSRCIVSDYGD